MTSMSTRLTVRRLAAITAASALIALAAAPSAAWQGGSGPAQGQTASGGDEGTRDLNRDQAAAARTQNTNNTLNAEAYSAATADYQATRTAVAEAQARYEREMAEYRRRQAEYEAAQARWQADVRACQGGDYSRCGTAAPTPN